MAGTEAVPEERGATGDAPPGPDGWPVIGNTIAFVRDPVDFYERMAAEYDGDVTRFRVSGDRGFMLTHPEDVERVLVTDDTAFRRASVSSDALGQVVDGGLLLLEDEEWQRHRSALQPAFYRERIETYAEMMVRYTDRLAGEWRDGERVVLQDDFRTLTLRILTKTLLDVDVRGEESAIGEAADEVTSRFDAGSLSAFLPLWVPTPRNRRAKRAIGTFEETIDGMIADRRASDGEFDDLLSILLDVEFADGSRIDEADVRDHLFTFLVAGHETTSLALTYATYLLANNPEKQDRLHAELDRVLDGESPTAADLFELDYLDGVAEEALRLYPPSYTVLREPTEDVSFGGYDVPEGSLLSLPQYIVHRDERWYDDPDAFRPERWTDAFREELPDYAYFPFGGGPRHCIGMRFAMMELKLVLATLARRYRFEPVTEPPLDLSMAITLQPAQDVEVDLVER